MNGLESLELKHAGSVSQVMVVRQQALVRALFFALKLSARPDTCLRGTGEFIFAGTKHRVEFGQNSAVHPLAV